MAQILSYCAETPVFASSQNQLRLSQQRDKSTMLMTNHTYRTRTPKECYGATSEGSNEDPMIPPYPNNILIHRLVTMANAIVRAGLLHRMRVPRRLMNHHQ